MNTENIKNKEATYTNPLYKKTTSTNIPRIEIDFLSIHSPKKNNTEEKFSNPIYKKASPKNISERKINISPLHSPKKNNTEEKFSNPLYKKTHPKDIQERKSKSPKTIPIESKVNFLQRKPKLLLDGNLSKKFRHSAKLSNDTYNDILSPLIKTSKKFSEPIIKENSNEQEQKVLVRTKSAVVEHNKKAPLQQKNRSTSFKGRNLNINLNSSSQNIQEDCLSARNHIISPIHSDLNFDTKNSSEISIQQYDKFEEYTQAKRYLVEELNSSMLMAINKSNLIFTILRASSLYQDIDSLDNLPRKKFDAFLFQSQLIQKIIISRVEFIRLKAMEYSKTKKNISFVDKFTVLLNSYSDNLKKSSKKSYLSKKLISSIKLKIKKSIDTRVYDLFFETVFLSKNDYNEFIAIVSKLDVWIKNNFLKINVCIDDTNDTEQKFMGISDKQPIKTTLLSNITNEGIKRSFCPDNRILFTKITVNDEEFCIEGCTSQEDFFQKLIRRCYSKIENVQEQFYEMELKNLFDKESRSQSKRMLAAATVECWSAADQMFKLKFPGLASAPFQPKYLQGTELKICKSDNSSFEVIQQKKCHIYLRSNPTEPNSFSVQGEPLCTLTLKWTVQSNEQDKDVFNENGELEIIEIEFAEGIFLYEKNEILASLKNLKTATNRQFPEF